MNWERRSHQRISVGQAMCLARSVVYPFTTKYTAMSEARPSRSEFSSRRYTELFLNLLADFGPLRNFIVPGRAELQLSGSGPGSSGVGETLRTI